MSASHLTQRCILQITKEELEVGSILTVTRPYVMFSSENDNLGRACYYKHVAYIYATVGTC